LTVTAAAWFVVIVLFAAWLDWYQQRGVDHDG